MSFVDDYRDWITERMKLSAQEDKGTSDAGDRIDDWAANDDIAVELLKQAAHQLADGHCLDCGNPFSEPVSEEDLLAGVGDGYGDAGNGFCQACDLGRRWNIEDDVVDA